MTSTRATSEDVVPDTVCRAMSGVASLTQAWMSLPLAKIRRPERRAATAYLLMHQAVTAATPWAATVATTVWISSPDRVTELVSTPDCSRPPLPYEPAWSPDGKKIAFETLRGGDPEIYVMKAKPENRKNRPKNLTKNGVVDFQPDWRPVL